MKTYQSHKTVQAVKILAIDFRGDRSARIYPETGESFEVSSEYCDKHKPKVGGYYVQYEDGYESWSPAKAFEEGYSEVSHRSVKGDLAEVINYHSLDDGTPDYILADYLYGCLQQFDAAVRARQRHNEG